MEFVRKISNFKIKMSSLRSKLAATSLLGKIQAGEETNTAENQGTTHLRQQKSS